MRGETFVTRKITRAVAAIELGLQERLYLGNLDAKRDWGHARDYVEGMWLMLQQDEPDDYVLATGETHSGARVRRARLRRRSAATIEWRGEGVDEKGVDAQTGKVLVEVDPRYFRPTEVDLLLGDPTQGARASSAGSHTTSFDELVARDGRGRSRRRSCARTASGCDDARVTRPMPISTRRQAGLGRRPSRHGRRALVRRLAREGCEILTVDARRASTCAARPTVEALAGSARGRRSSFVAAAKVGGILANDTLPGRVPLRQPDDRGERHPRRAARRASRSCCSSARPASIRKLAPQPIREDALLTGPLEPTNEWYAIAKIAGIKLCQAYRRQYGCDFISAMPTNLYGPGDNYDLDASHVAAGADPQGARGEAAERRAELEVWGTGTPRREFLHVDDLADALVFLLKHYSGDEHVNVGSAQT